MPFDRPDPFEPEEARLLRPPPVGARLLRPPGPPPPPPPGRRPFGALLGDGLRAAARAPLVVAGIFVCRTLEAVAALAPLLYAWTLLEGPIARGDPLAAVAIALSPATWIVPAGILVACLIAAAVLELVVWSGGIGVLDRVVRRQKPIEAVGTFADGFGSAFPRLVIVAACMLAARVGLALFGWTLALSAVGAALAGDGPGVAFVAAAGLSLAAVVGIAGSIFLPIVYELALARCAALGEPPLAAILGAAALLLRRPLVLGGVAVAIGLGTGVFAASTGVPVQLLFEGGVGVAVAVAASQLIAYAIAAFASVVRLGAWISAARDAQAAEGRA